MEDWYTIVRNMKDESEQPFLTQQITHKIYRDLKTRTVKERTKFKERMGMEFNKWVATLYQLYPTDLVNQIIHDDDFWLTTLQLSHI
jgi:hypothetical protein